MLARGAGREACPREGGGATAATGPSPSSASAAAAPGKAPPSPPLSGTCAGRRGAAGSFLLRGAGEGGVRLPRCPTRCSVASSPGAEPRLRVGPSWRHGDRSQASPVPCTPRGVRRDPLRQRPGAARRRSSSAAAPPALGASGAEAGLGCSRLFGNSLGHK